MADELLAAESAREFFQNPRLVELAIHHPLLGLTAVLWISVAYGCVQLADRKGHDDQVWGTLGLMFSVVTLIVLLALPSTKPTGRAAELHRAGDDRAPVGQLPKQANVKSALLVGRSG